MGRNSVYLTRMLSLIVIWCEIEYLHDTYGAGEVFGIREVCGSCGEALQSCGSRK